LWSTEKTSRVRLAEPGDIVDNIAYTMANPVSSFLVMYGRSWPGLRLAWSAGAKPQVFRRPVGFLRPDTGRWRRHRKSYRGNMQWLMINY
jgi:hypothetical protein